MAVCVACARACAWPAGVSVCIAPSCLSLPHASHAETRVYSVSIDPEHNLAKGKQPLDLLQTFKGFRGATHLQQKTVSACHRFVTFFVSIVISLHVIGKAVGVMHKPFLHGIGVHRGGTCPSDRWQLGCCSSCPGGRHRDDP